MLPGFFLSFAIFCSWSSCSSNASQGLMEQRTCSFIHPRFGQSPINPLADLFVGQGGNPLSAPHEGHNNAQVVQQRGDLLWQRAFRVVSLGLAEILYFPQQAERWLLMLE